ncbi:S-layer homology domain-containing protein [Evtepia sp.]|uniref:S-layer homology domain-containing protein n=1 Tax=Evtepia sp. TaxID=2773933 RepID=UPI002A7F8278|nr:S-layer homology domain-containing protein [Evtepia sp.]MDY4429857.1 S-layer homology domain-containing protein [Evtepia sp.]
MKRITSLLLVMLFLLSLVPTAFAVAAPAPAEEETPAEVVNSDTQWSYWDQETDPVINSEMYQKYPIRILWAYGSLLGDASWKTAAGPFGAKNGAIADLGDGCTPKTLLNQYKEDGDDIEAYFFVTTFTVTADQLAEAKQILGSLYYDDSAVVYLNSGKVASFDEPEGGFTQNMEYGGSNASAPKLGEFTLTDVSALQEGTNVLAVEIHQGRADSSDIYFDFQSLALSTEEPDYSSLPLEQDTAALSVGGTETEMNFTWYASTEEAGTIAYAPASALADGQLPENAATAAAVATVSNRGGYYSNQLTLTGLQPDTTYAYQLTNTKGDEVVTSNIATFTTGGGETTKFLFVGDPQLGSSGNLASDTTGWDTTLNKAAAMFPDATFLLSAGDQVDAAASEEQYQSYLNRSVLSSLPQATTIGNHDSSSNSYDQHFNVANESDTYGTTNAGGDNWFVYNNVLFMDLNSNDLSTAEHKAFMEEAIAANPNVSWKIVVFHHSIFSVASHAEDSDILQRRDELAPVFKELDIDIVLMGHDHVYTRSYMMDGLTPMTDASIYDDASYSSITDPTGILYVTANSASGSKYYEISGQYAYAAVQNQAKVPNVSYVEMDDSHFTITTYRASDMSVVDTFTINRTSGSSADGLPFTDVKSGSWFEDAVDYVYAKGMMTGTSATTFAPNSTTTRAMIVTILYRLENEPTAGTASFTDVASSAYYAKAVAWAAENGVVTGTTETTFAPNSPITREQMAAILYRYAGLKGYDANQKADLSGYTDAGTISAYASDALAWTNAQGLITGVTDTTLAPKNSATRAQVATILMRFCETIAQ